MLFTQINENERGLVFKNGKLVDVLKPAIYRNVLLKWRTEIQRVSTKENMLIHSELKQIVKSGLLAKETKVLDLSETERALVWIDRRFYGILGAGLHVLWTVDREVQVELFEVSEARFEHAKLETIRASTTASQNLQTIAVPKGCKGLLMVEQKVTEVLEPGRYTYWKGVKDIAILNINMQEETVAVSGQELMTKDRVSLRVNADISTRVVDPVLYNEVNPIGTSALYKRTQLILREQIGRLDLDELLEGKDSLNETMFERVQAEAEKLGMAATSFGIRDVILPGDMKALLNRVVEARKSAEASNITRREETAAMRSQLNTAKLIENNPTLMRIRELETLERVAQNGKLTVVLGEKGLTEKVTNLI